MVTRSYDVEIAGIPLKLRSSHDEKIVKELIAFVDQKFSESLAATKSGSIQNAALLASLNIAEELFLLKRQAQNELSILEQNTQKLLSDLESSQCLLEADSASKLDC